ncbi:MAG: regulatory iron-sulfur-containing complex subunit RicT [Smithellaceae bacterium]
MLTNIIGVKFKKEGRIYNFDACDLILHKDDQVIVQTDNGPALGVVVTEVRRCTQAELPPNLKKIIRQVTPDDLRIREEIEKLEAQAKAFCTEKIAEKGLAMKLITVDSIFDKSKMIFYFTAENRVDFRELVKDLVARFKTRIELKQIGARQEARIVKGLAVCGRIVCCGGILQNLDRVTVKMAKEQSMSLNPEKISGLCGRLMCCLSYEHESYAKAKKSPKPVKIEEPAKTAPEAPPKARHMITPPRNKKPGADTP